MQINKSLSLSLSLSFSLSCQKCVNIVQTCFAIYVAALQLKLNDELSHQIWKKITQTVFRLSDGDQYRQWALDQVCTSCSSRLRNWLNKQTSAMPSYDIEGT